jgi:hypothetical protein
MVAVSQTLAKADAPEGNDLIAENNAIETSAMIVSLWSERTDCAPAPVVPSHLLCPSANATAMAQTTIPSKDQLGSGEMLKPSPIANVAVENQVQTKNVN